METAPRNCRFLSLVLVERVLNPPPPKRWPRKSIMPILGRHFNGLFGRFSSPLGPFSGGVRDGSLQTLRCTFGVSGLCKRSGRLQNVGVRSLSSLKGGGHIGRRKTFFQGITHEVCIFAENIQARKRHINITNLGRNPPSQTPPQRDH